MESAIYVVATPIGNMEDMSPRAQRVLSEVSLIAAEDTRHTRRLLDNFGISTPMVSFHEHNERQKAETLIAKVRDEGEAVALVSDAGTPLISDPGYILVAQAREAGVNVIPVPGPSALIVALCASGLPSHRFAFEGFLPSKAGARRAALEMLQSEPRTIIYYESTHRIMTTLELLAELFPERRVCVARELTKRYETLYTASASEILQCLKTDSVQQKGEFVLIVEGVSVNELQVHREQSLPADELLRRLLKDLPPKQAAAVVSDLTGRPKKELYNQAVVIKSS